MASTAQPLTGKTVLITGAARGIGWESAKRLHGLGANLALVGLEPELLAERAQTLGEQRSASWEADVTSVEQLEAAVAGAVERFGGLDVVIANAGVHYTGSFESAPLSQLEREFEINLLGVIRTNKVVVDHLIKSKGYLLNVASLAAAANAPLMTSYAGSKAAVEAHSNSLRVELGARGVAVGTAYFGFIDTDMVRDAFDAGSAETLKPLMPSFVRNTVSVDQAVDAVERGVLKRKSRTWAPRYVGAVLALRGVIQPLSERRMLLAKGTVLKALAQAAGEQVIDRAGSLKKADDAPAPAAKAEANGKGTNGRKATKV